MQSSESLNIYLEHLIPNETKQQVWDTLTYSKEFKSLFIEKEKPIFSTNESGVLVWKKFFFFSVEGQYFIDSFEKEKNLLFSVKTDKFSSLVVITLDDTREGILLRLDHRSFFGKNKKLYHNTFLKKWKSLFNIYIKKEKEEAKKNKKS